MLLHSHNFINGVKANKWGDGPGKPRWTGAGGNTWLSSKETMRGSEGPLEDPKVRAEASGKAGGHTAPLFSLQSDWVCENKCIISLTFPTQTWFRVPCMFLPLPLNESWWIKAQNRMATATVTPLGVGPELRRNTKNNEIAPVWMGQKWWGEATISLKVYTISSSGKV